jgi:HSP20 family protein
MNNYRNEQDRHFHHHHSSEDESGTCDCHPLVDISESKDDFVIKAELPGMSKGDVKINIADDILTISGDKKADDKEEGHTFHRIERTYGKFQRNFSLPAHIQSDKIKASFKDGILTIMLPKKEEVKPKEISISVA